MQEITSISTGDPHARTRPINDIVTEQIDLLAAVSSQLMREGHTVIGVAIEPTGGLPTVQLAGSPRLSQMVADNQATYYKRETVGFSTYNTGQFQRGGVRVLWLELGWR